MGQMEQPRQLASELFEVEEPLSDAIIRPDSPPDAEDGFSLLVEGATEYAVFTLSPSGIVSTWNRGAQRMKGYEPDEVIGRHFSLFYPEAEQEAGLPSRLLAEAITCGRAEAEGSRVRKDGSTFWASVLIVPLRDMGGRLRGFAKLTRDESDRRAAQILHEKLAVMNEQERIASALAGTVVHRLYEVGLGLAGALELATETPALAHRLRSVSDQVDDTIKYLRQMVFEVSKGTASGSAPSSPGEAI